MLICHRAQLGTCHEGEYWNRTVVAEHWIVSRQFGPVPEPRSLHFTRNGNCGSRIGRRRLLLLSRRPLHLAAESCTPCTSWNGFAGLTPKADVR